MKRIWFTADTHFGHENIIRYCNRPFASAKEMNIVLKERWNDLVKPQDIVYCIGDLAKDLESNLLAIKGLHGQKTLIRGNHDPRNAMCSLKTMGWLEVLESHSLVIYGQNVLLSHYPFAGIDSYPDEEGNASSKGPANNGEWLLHGHVHQRWKQNGRMINVGVDVWDFRPVSMDEIEAIIARN